MLSRLSSIFTHNTDQVFVQRDYSEGIDVKFHTRLPSELEGKIERQVFEMTINHINKLYAEANAASCSTYCMGLLNCITGYLLSICLETQFEKILREIADYIAIQNEFIYNPKGYMIIHPIAHGMRVLEIARLAALRPITETPPESPSDRQFCL